MMKKPHRLGFQFIVVGGLEKGFYERLRQLRQKYDLSDKGLVECLLWHHLLREEDDKNWHHQEYQGPSFARVVEMYKDTAPSEMPPLPEVVGVVSESPRE